MQLGSATAWAPRRTFLPGDSMARSPIAIVGMGCRFGHIESLSDFWQLLKAGGNALGPIPTDRFSLEKFYNAQPGMKGKVISQEGAYFRNIKDFDARFFRISPREAAAMDPQQRVLLEVTWNAIQDAGLTTGQLDGSRTGVYVGLFTSDFRERLVKLPDFDVDVYTEIGSTRSSTAGRVAYAFNLTGPTVALDAACASSLVAVHLACNSIWNGESGMAIAAGTNVILEPDTTICFSRSKMLSPRSRCRFGDASADGFVRSDGVGAVILKPLEQAIADGDRIYSVIRATAVNNDARQGNGLFMTPSQEGQKQLLRTVYHQPGVDIQKLQYVEAHGTGTRAGDPVECGAIAEILGKQRTDATPLYLGSVKTNIGHTEGAAGIAALIKTALSLYHRTIPPSLYFETPNPDIPWQEGKITVATTAIALPPEQSVQAGVSSFGLSGTNAHAVLESWQTAQRPSLATSVQSQSSISSPMSHPVHGNSGDNYILPLSAHSPEALKALLERFADHIGTHTASASGAAVAGTGTDLNSASQVPVAAAEADKDDSSDDRVWDICYTAAARRSPLQYRVAVIGSTASALKESLLQLSASPPETFAEARDAKVAFICPGQGGQWAGMGAALLAKESAFMAAITAIDEVFQARQDWSILDAMRDPAAGWLSDIAKVQPMLFAIQVGLGRLWEFYGVKSGAVIGHSLGEVAAAHLSGALSLADAVDVISVRSRALASIRGQGAMAVVGLDQDETQELLEGLETSVTIAVSNSRASTVIAGDPNVITMLLEELTARGVYNTRVDVDVASHSPQTEPLLPRLMEELSHIVPSPGEVPFYSTVTCDVMPGQALTPEYWTRNMRQTVRFYETTDRLIKEGFEVFIELGPHPVLLNPLSQTLREAGAHGLTVSSMRRDTPSQTTLYNGLAQLFSYGLSIQWKALYGTGVHVTLPDYPFQRETYWLMDEVSAETEEGEHRSSIATASHRKTRKGSHAHPLLPHHLRLGATPEVSLWELPLSTRRYPYLADHKVKGSVLLPGAAFAEVALAAAQEHFGLESDAFGRLSLEGLELLDYLVVPSREERALQVQLSLQTPTLAEVRFFSFEESGTDERPPRFHAIALVRLQAESLDSISPEMSMSSADASHTVDSKSVSEDKRLRFREQLELERLQAKHSGQSSAALLSLRINPLGPNGEVANPKQLARRLALLLRSSDIVYPAAPGQYLLLLRRMKRGEYLRSLSQRLARRLLDGVDLVPVPDRHHPAHRGPILELRGQTLDAAQSVSELLEQALLEQLPLLDIDTATQEPSALSGEHSPASQESSKDVLQSGESFYDGMTKRGIQYGPSFQPVVQLNRQGDHARVELRLPDVLASRLDGHVLHPAVLDGCFQAAVGAFLNQSSDDQTEQNGEHTGSALLPVGLKRLSVHGKTPHHMHCQAWLRKSGERADELEIDFEVCDIHRKPFLTVEGFRVRLFERQNIVSPQLAWRNWLHHWQWEQDTQSLSTLANTNAEGTFIVLEESVPLGDLFEEQMKALGSSVVRVALLPQEQAVCLCDSFEGPTPESPSPLRHPQPLQQVMELFLKLARERQEPFASSRPLAGIVYLCTQVASPMDSESLLNESVNRGARLTELSRTMGAYADLIPSFYLVTAGAWQVDNTQANASATSAPTSSSNSSAPVAAVSTFNASTYSPSPDAVGAPLAPLAQSTGWGFMRVLANEKPELTPRIVDIPSNPKPRDLAELAAVVTGIHAIDECAIREGQRYLHVLQPGLSEPRVTRTRTRPVPIDSNTVLSRQIQSGSKIAESPSAEAIKWHWSIRQTPQAADAQEELRCEVPAGHLLVQIESVEMPAGALLQPEESIAGAVATILLIGSGVKGFSAGQRIVTPLTPGMQSSQAAITSDATGGGIQSEGLNASSLPSVRSSETAALTVDAAANPLIVGRVAVSEQVLIARHMVVNAAHVISLPDHFRAEEAASIAASFVPAWMALQPWQGTRTPAQPGERLLIQTAGTRMGVAAALLAHLSGAYVIATAPLLETRETLRGFGIPIVLTETASELQEQLPSLLNSIKLDRIIGFGGMRLAQLAAPATHGTRLSHSQQANGAIVGLQGLIRPAGQLVLFGNAGLPSTEDLSTRRSLSLIRLSPQELLCHRPEQVKTALGRTFRFLLLKASHLIVTPVPQSPVADLWRSERTFTPAELKSLTAFAQERPDAPVSLSMDKPCIEIEEELTPGTLYEKSASYWISGGLGGLGTLLARHLARSGAGHVVLISRQAEDLAGLDDPSSWNTKTLNTGSLSEVQGDKTADSFTRQPHTDSATSGRSTGASIANLRSELAQHGCQLWVVRSDVNDFTDLCATYNRIVPKLPSVQGIFHLAGCLSDGTLEHLTAQNFEQVMSPKIKGAWNLHRLSQRMSLTHFVLFASAATTLGSPGQANYAAANAFLDGLAQYRRQLGQPALSIDWGTWAEAGLAVARDDRAARLESRGLEAMSSADAFQAMESAMLQLGNPSVGVFSIDWQKWSQAFPRVGRVQSTRHRVPSLLSTPSAMQQSILEQLSQNSTERKTLLESFLKQHLAEVLRMPPARLTMHIPMAQLGMDSLMTVELRSRLREHLKVELSPSRILAMPHPGALAEALMLLLYPATSSGSDAQHLATDSTAQASNAMPRVQLDGWIKTSVLAAPATNPKSVFVTGASGFLGAYVVRSLLDRTTANIHCLVRASDEASALQRLRQNLEYYQLWRPEDEARLIVVPGDLEKQFFGLSKVAFRTLAESVEAIYHCAAWVNHLYPYDRLAPINVKGTQEVLRLAVVAGSLPVHHVSTIAVFPFTPDPTRQWTIQESTPLEPTTEPFFAGYTQSKWVAEKMIERARARGLNVNIYRPGAITGSTQTGQCPDSDTIWRMVQLAVNMGMVPRTSASIGLTPVDAVADAMVQLSLQPQSVNQTFHLFGDAPLSLSSIVETLESMGYPMRSVTFDGWRRRIGGEEERNSAMAALLPRLLELDLERLDHSTIQTSSQQTLARLSSELRERMQVGNALLRKYIEVLQSTGFLPRPVPVRRLPTRLTSPGLLPMTPM